MTEAELVFTRALGCERHALYLDKSRVLDKEAQSFVSSVFKSRLEGKPLQYILGETEFMGLNFRVDGSVLIPRPETEILVSTVLKYAERLPAGRILELGTGSGCIAVSLAKLSAWQVTAVDISTAALNNAKENALLNNVAVDFLKSDLFAAFAGKKDLFDICVSNPPYVRSSDIETLSPEIQYEPRNALDGGEDGLEFYRRIIQDAPGRMKKGALLILEIGFGQCEKVRKILQNSLNFEIIEIVKDYNDIERVIVAKRCSALFSSKLQRKINV